MATTDALSGLDTITQAKNPSKSEIAGAQATSDFNFFLKMLTVQLQNQDPTEPMDVSQMTQQIAQYSAVEQQVQTNSNLEKLLTQQKQSQLSTAVSYIGKEVETEGNTGTLVYAQDGTQSGLAEFEYELPAGVSSTTINVLDEDGNIVYTGNGPTAAGENIINWSGINSITKQPMAAGEYSIEVIAKDSTGAVMSGVSLGEQAELVYSATVVGQATFSYVLDTAAHTSEVTITNSAGQAVFQGQGPKAKGRNVVVWDGVNSFSGESVPAGKYTMTVKAKDIEGEAITTKTYAVGVVNTVETDKNGVIKLTVGDVVVDFDDIVAIREPTPLISG